MFGSSGAPANDADPELFERLRTLRKRLADEAGKPPYIVFSDAALRDMCAKRPATDEEFLEVSGVGATKLARYGGAGACKRAMIRLAASDPCEKSAPLSLAL